MTDQQLHGIQATRKSYKWSSKVGIHLIMLSALNASKLYAIHTNEKTRFLKFMHDVIAMLLIASPCLNRKALREETVHRLTGRHFPTVHGMQESGKRRLTKICRVCYARGVRQNSGNPVETIYICKTCPSQPGLHVDIGCFELYHTKFRL